MSEKRTELSREDVAKIEIGHTELTGSMAWVLCLVFLAMIVSVPVIQTLREGAISGGSDLVALPGRAGEVFSEAEGSMFHRLMAGNRTILQGINAYEDDLEDGSFLTTMLVPPVQEFMARHLGAGNEKAYVGKDQWLFYRPGVDYLTGPGFLNPQQLERIAGSGSEWAPPPQPDPRKAILDFHRQLEKRGIVLVLVPTPVKPAVHADQFTGRYDQAGVTRPLHNVSYRALLQELGRQGVLVCELDSVLSAASKPLYLATDTHWRPEAMEAVARHLGAFVRDKVALPAGTEAGYKRAAETVTNLGDVARMMKLPENQKLVEPETVRIHQVLQPDDNFWRPSATGDVLLLGDSFSNIYSLGSMDWGSSAGLAEQLSFELQRPIDTIVRNDDGAHATRHALSRDLARGKDRLEGKRVVVWQFAERELSVGDWKVLELKLGSPEPSQFVTPATGQEMLVTGVVEAVSAAPRPGSVPYKDHIITVRLRDLESSDGPIPGGEALVYLWSMRDNVWTPAARLREREKITLRLQSWYDVVEDYEAINRSELDSEDLQFEDPCWGTLLEVNEN